MSGPMESVPPVRLLSVIFELFEDGEIMAVVEGPTSGLTRYAGDPPAEVVVGLARSARQWLTRTPLAAPDATERPGA